MPTTADTVAAVAADLEAGRIPDRDGLAEFMAAWRRLQAGTPFDAAIGRNGPIGRRERDAAIAELAKGLNGSLWGRAELIRRLLQDTPTTEAARAAVALGGRKLGRQAIYKFLVEESLVDLVQTPADDTQNDLQQGQTDEPH